MSILETVSTPKKKNISLRLCPDIAPSTRIEAFTLEKAQFSGLVFSKWLQLEHTESERFFNPEPLVTYSKGVLVTC